MTMSGPVAITGNEARFEGGAIWAEGSQLVLPSDADISDNTAIVVSAFSSAILGFRETLFLHEAPSVRATRLTAAFSFEAIVRLPPGVDPFALPPSNVTFPSTMLAFSYARNISCCDNVKMRLGMLFERVFRVSPLVFAAPSALRGTTTLLDLSVPVGGDF